MSKRKYPEARSLYQEVSGEFDKALGDKHSESRNVMKLFIKLLFKIPEIPTAISMIHVCIKRYLCIYTYIYINIYAYA
jgi:hypothetical protein